MATFEQLEIQAISKALDGAVETVVKKVTADVTANLQEATPVKTGWAQSNWVPKIGRGINGVVGSKVGVLTTAQITGLLEVQSRYKVSQGKVFINNNVPYILVLNDGTSTQAPRGFVQIAIRKAVTEDILSLDSG